ncbi:MAG TPA: hypothetical protein DCY13_19720, partial [Verrucomicrobiales bacterium]|nr:hypothetical protein [Verrucomicrobiales bacterium]
VRAVIGELLPLASRVVLTPIQSPRSASTDQLAEQIRSLLPELQLTRCVSLAEALESVTGDSRVLVTGSLFLVGEALQLLDPDEVTAREQGLNDWLPAPPPAGAAASVGTDSRPQNVNR